MRIRIGFDIGLEFARATPVVARLNVRPSRIPDLLSPDDLMIEPCLDQETFIDDFGNRCVRLDAPAGLLHIRTDAIVADTGEHDVWHRKPAKSP